MTKIDKAIQRLQTHPKDFTYDETRQLLKTFGYKEMNKGKTSGSRVVFVRESDMRKIMLHRPHPGNCLLPYQIKDLLDHLKRNGDIS